jgi:hypothetical protein
MREPYYGKVICLEISDVAKLVIVFTAIQRQYRCGISRVPQLTILEVIQDLEGQI